MRVTIIKDDNAVIVNGERYTVDCGTLPADFHALQWDGTEGEVEFRVTRCDHCGARTKKGNLLIADLSPYALYVDAWRAAKTKADAERAKAEAELQAAIEEAKARAAG